MSTDIWKELESSVSDYSFKRSQDLLKQAAPDKSGIVDKVSKLFKLSRDTWRDSVVDYAVSTVLFASMPIPKKLEAEIILASKLAAVYGRFLETHQGAFLSEEVRDEMIEQVQIIKAPAALIVGLFQGSSGLVKAGLDKIGMTQENIERALAKSVEAFGKLSPEAQEEAIWGELIPKVAARAAAGGAEVPKKAMDKKTVEREAQEFLATGKESTSIPEEVKAELANLKAFLDDQSAARTFNNFALGFSHMQEFGTRLNMPIFTQIGVFGSRAFSLVSAMRDVSRMHAAGSLLSLEGASVMFSMSLTAVSLMSMFMQEDSSHGLEDLLDVIMPALQSISHQLGELKMQLAAFQVETRFEFQRASFELSLVHASLARLSHLNLHEIKSLRKALDIRFEEVTSKIQESSAETHYRLEELQFEPLKEAVDAIEFADVRSLDLATLKKAGTLIERWLSAPPCAEIVNGVYFTKKAFDLSAFLKLSLGALTGPIAIFAQEQEIPGLEAFDPATLINPEFFATLVPSYFKYLKALKTRGEVYDADGSLFESKLLAPLKTARSHHEVLRANRGVFAKLFTKLDTLQAERAAHILAIADEKAAELIAPIQAECIESNARASVAMQKPLWEFTRHAPYHGGWGLNQDSITHSPFWVRKDIGKLASLLAARQVKVAEKASAINLRPMSIKATLEDAKTAVSLNGRLAEVSVHDPKVYLYPTYVPLDDLELTPEIKEALVAEKAGLGRLEIKAILTQSLLRHHGLYFVNASPFYSKEELETFEYMGNETPMAPKELPLNLEFSFVYKESGSRKIISSEMYTLEAGADPFVAYQTMYGGTAFEMFPEMGACWNGDALSLAISSRFENKRNLSSREVNEGNVLELKTKLEARFETLRAELFDESSGNPALKKRLKETTLKIERQIAQVYSFAKYLLGIEIEKADLENLIKLPSIKHNELLVSPYMGYDAFRAKYLERAEINDPVFKLLKELEARVHLGYGQVLAMPLVRREEPSASETSGLATRVRDLTLEVEAMREENGELKAMMQIMMKQMQTFSEALGKK